MADPDDPGTRTMLVGIFLGMGLYILALVFRQTLPEPYNITLWMSTTLLGLVILTGWFFAVKRGFRIRWLGRYVSRRSKGRKTRRF